MEALHHEEGGGHFAAIRTAQKLCGQGYWWPELNKDVAEFVKACEVCQQGGRPAKRHLWPLTPIMPLAPFEKWGIDFNGPINPSSSRGNRYIILATDYSTKWVEAKATWKNDTKVAANFLFDQILMRFGYPLELVSDQGKHFLNVLIKALTERYYISHGKTTPYNPKANGLTERADGIVGKMLNKMRSVHQQDWDEKLSSAVFAYNCTMKSTMGYTPYFLVYGMMPIQRVEHKVETTRLVNMWNQDPEVMMEARTEKIDCLEEACRLSLKKTTEVQNTRKHRYDEKTSSHRNILAGDKVLLYDSRYDTFPRKLQTQWMGPYKVHAIYGNGSMQLTDPKGKHLPTRVNGSGIKRFYQLPKLGIGTTHKLVGTLVGEKGMMSDAPPAHNEA
jgi:transposase InsO family protein